MDQLDFIADAGDSEWVISRLFLQLFSAVSAQSQATSYIANPLTSFVTYCYSWYGLTCMAMAIILNRTLVIASTNNTRIQQMAVNRSRNLGHNDLKTELLKRTSQFLFRMGVVGILCYNMYKILVTLNVTSKLTRSEEDLNWFVRLLNATGWFNYDVETTDKYMKTPKYQVMVGPSASLYWPVFLGFCFLVYVETFLAAIEGNKPYTEAGLTVFEHSLIFQEASSAGRFFLGDSRIVRRPTEELLIICLFLTLNHLNIQIGGLINQNKYRLIPSSIIGLGFLSYFTNILLKGQWYQFPIIVVLLVLPQLFIIGIIGLSIAIFVMAIFATGLNFRDLNYASFFLNNDGPEFQEQIFFRLLDDFYTTLLNLGMLAITLAGKSSYITELSIVTVDDETWIERNIWEKFKQNFEFLKSNKSIKTNRQLIDYIKGSTLKGYGNVITDPSMDLVRAGNSEQDHNLEGLNKTSIIKKRVLYLQVIILNFYQLVKGITWDKLLNRLFKRSVIMEETKYDSKGYEITEQFEKRRSMVPPFLRKFIKQKELHPAGGASKTYRSDSQQKIIELDDFTEEELSTQYVRLLKDNEISEIDNSMDFQGDEEDSEEDIDIDGSDIESVIDSNEFLSPDQFAELVSESNIDILQRHLHTEGILTRAQYNMINNRINEYKDESTKLIEVLLSKRQGHLQKLLNSGKGDFNLNGNDDDDMLDRSLIDCVICQVNTREVITWPCKCFSICESCRLTLASKGIEGCVCCRRPVDGVSRVFIP